MNIDAKIVGEFVLFALANAALPIILSRTHGEYKEDEKLKQNLITLGWPALIGVFLSRGAESLLDFIFQVGGCWFFGMIICGFAFSSMQNKLKNDRIKRERMDDRMREKDMEIRKLRDDLEKYKKDGK